MEPIRGISALFPMSAPAPIGPSRPAAIDRAPVRRSDTGEFAEGAGLRARLAAAHDGTLHLQRTAFIVNSAEDALERADVLLGEARGAFDNEAVTRVDGIIVQVEDVTSAPAFGGAAILREGITLHAGTASLDVRPMTPADLGAVVAGGRSHRLADVRSGGTLDPVSSRTVAIRSIEAASDEVSAARSQLAHFREIGLEPARRDVLKSIRSITAVGPSDGREAIETSAIARESLGASPVLRSLARHEPSRVLALLG